MSMINVIPEGKSKVHHTNIMIWLTPVDLPRDANWDNFSSSRICAGMSFSEDKQ